MTTFEITKERLRANPKVWLVTGVAGFIGSNLLQFLLELDQQVVGLDNFSTGKRENLKEVEGLVTDSQWARFRFFEGDTQNPGDCKRVCEGVDYVLHQAALGSVPRSLEEPAVSHGSNVTGMVNTFLAARDAGVKRFVYASSSAVYGDHPSLPKTEAETGNCLSPYAATKLIDEIYAGVYARCYGVPAVGLRYFNVFGRRQDPDGPYAAVIPKWVAGLLSGEPILINGDGETSRDFCYIENVVQANVLAAVADVGESAHEVCNVAIHARTTLNELFAMIKTRLAVSEPLLGFAKQ